MRYSLVYIIFIFCNAPTLTRGDIILSVNDLEVTLSSSRSYTFGDIKRNGNLFCDGAVSSQGTILIIDNVFCGSGHGSEELLEANLHVDGKSVEIQQDRVYTGRHIEMHRRTCLDMAYILKPNLIITE